MNLESGCLDERRSRVIDTANITIKQSKKHGKETHIRLYGVEKTSGFIVGDFTIMPGSRGGVLECKPAVGKTFRCFLPDGSDIAKEAIRSGFTYALQPASPDYIQAETEARQSKAGIWGIGREASGRN